MNRVLVAIGSAMLAAFISFSAHSEPLDNPIGGATSRRSMKRLRYRSLAVTVDS